MLILNWLYVFPFIIEVDGENVVRLVTLVMPAKGENERRCTRPSQYYSPTNILLT